MRSPITERSEEDFQGKLEQAMEENKRLRIDLSLKSENYDQQTQDFKDLFQVRGSAYSFASFRFSLEIDQIRKRESANGAGLRG